LVQDPPLLRANYFSHPLDVAVLVAAVKAALKLGRNSAFTQFGAKFYDQPLPSCSQVQLI
jgi:hypothetical protein